MSSSDFYKRRFSACESVHEGRVNARRHRSTPSPAPLIQQFLIRLGKRFGRDGRGDIISGGDVTGLGLFNGNFAFRVGKVAISDERCNLCCFSVDNCVIVGMSAKSQS